MAVVFTVPTLVVYFALLLPVMLAWGYASWRFIDWFVNRWIDRHQAKRVPALPPTEGREDTHA